MSGGSERRKRWDELTHSSGSAYNIRLRYFMGPFQRIASLSPWYDRNQSRKYFETLAQVYREWLSGSSVLDVGCGPGKLSKKFCDDSLAKSYVGVDYSLGMAKDASSSYPTHVFVNASTTDLPFADASFEIVHSTRLFHHIPPDVRTKSIQDQLRVAKRAVIIEDLFGFGASFWYWPHRVYYTWADGSYYRYTLQEWSSMFAAIGAKVARHFSTDERVILGRCACWVITH